MCRTNIFRDLATAGALCCLLALVGCTVGPHYHPPTAPAAGTYTPAPQPSQTVSTSGLAGDAQRFGSTTDLPAQWWTLFQSPQINRMVQQALENSPTLAQAQAKLKEAQEELGARTGATKYPSVGGSASVQEEQPNLAAYGIPFPNPAPFTLLNGSIAVSYALDLFGANRHLIEGLRAQTEYEAWQLEGAHLMLAGNVVTTAIRQAQVRSQIEVTQRMVALQKQELSIVEQRLHAGGASEAEVRSQRTTVAQLQASLPPLKLQLDTMNDQLALLMGKPASEAQVETVRLEDLHLPSDLPLSLPSALVRQRPDIRGAEALLHQASANVGVATANLYPQIVLTGSGGGIGTKFTSGGDLWNVGASLTQPLYNGGALHAEKRKAEAAYQEAGSVYRQTVLQAFREVADELHAITRDAEALQARTEAAAAAEDSYQIDSHRYQSGGISQLALLDAQRQQLQTALDRSTSAANRFADSATLFEVLGGGWWNAKSADPNQAHASAAR
ncbi:MAG: efflux transporter outer membrane subunit [Terracidiphilus sp.]